MNTNKHSNSQTDKFYHDFMKSNLSSLLNTKNKAFFNTGTYNTDLFTRNKPKLSTKNIKLKEHNEDYKAYKKEEKAILNIPLIQNRTFNQMRKYYNLQNKDPIKLEAYDDKHLKDIAQRSIQNPINREKIYDIISLNKIRGIGYTNLSHFVNSLKTEKIAIFSDKYNN
jgi:hypothetical protein